MISHIIIFRILYNIISVVVAVTTPVAVSSVYGDKTRRVHTWNCQTALYYARLGKHCGYHLSAAAAAAAQCCARRMSDGRRHRRLYTTWVVYDVFIIIVIIFLFTGAWRTHVTSATWVRVYVKFFTTMYTCVYAFGTAFLLRRASSNGLRDAYATDVYIKARARARPAQCAVVTFLLLLFILFFSIVMTNPGDVVRHVLDEITLTTTTTTTFSRAHGFRCNSSDGGGGYTMHTIHEYLRYTRRMYIGSCKTYPSFGQHNGINRSTSFCIFDAYFYRLVVYCIIILCSQNKFLPLYGVTNTFWCKLVLWICPTKMSKMSRKIKSISLKGGGGNIVLYFYQDKEHAVQLLWKNTTNVNSSGTAITTTLYLDPTDVKRPTWWRLLVR